MSETAQLKESYLLVLYDIQSVKSMELSKYKSEEVRICLQFGMKYRSLTHTIERACQRNVLQAVKRHEFQEETGGIL